MNFKKITVKLLRLIGYIIACLAIIGIGFYIYWFKPYIIKLEEVRTTNKMVTIRAYWGRACGADFLAEDPSGTRLNLVTPKGGTTPRDTKAVVPGNLFIITGYRYKNIYKNLLNGNITEKQSPRIDVVKWNIVPPYSTYVNEKDVLIKKSNKPLGWKSKESEPKFASYKQPESEGC